MQLAEHTVRAFGRRAACDGRASHGQVDVLSTSYGRVPLRAERLEGFTPRPDVLTLAAHRVTGAVERFAAALRKHNK